MDDFSRSSDRPPSHSRRMATRSSRWPWLAVAAVAALLFVLTIRALLDRTAGTAGPSSQHVTQPADPYPPAQGSSDDHYMEPLPVPMVYRCVDRANGVSFQSQPCGPGQRTTRAIPAPPEPEPVRPRQPSRANVSAPESYSSSWAPGNDERARRRAQCANARQDREETLRRIGLRRTYDLLQRLDTVVNEACKGL